MTYSRSFQTDRGNTELNLKLTAPYMVETDGPGQSNAEAGVVTSIVISLAFSLQRSGASAGKILPLPVTILNLLPSLSKAFTFPILFQSLSQMLLSLGPMLVRIVSSYNRNIVQ